MIVTTPDFSKVFVAHSCLGLQTTSPRRFPPVSEVFIFTNHTRMTIVPHLETGIVNKADCHQIGRVLTLEKVEHLVPGSDDYNVDCNEMIIL